MSLWYESLSLDLYDCGDNLQERARCVRHLSMPVPRDWWDRALVTGKVDPTQEKLGDVVDNAYKTGIHKR